MKLFPINRRKPDVKPIFRNYCMNNSSLSGTSSYFLASHYAKVYNYPAPPTTPVVFGVISFGGSLYGTYKSSTCDLTLGDVQNYWQLCNIMPANLPKVKIVALPRATLNPAASGTDENTLDVSTIGACCPGSNVTIVLYVAPNSMAGFLAAFKAAINGMTTASGVKIPPSNIISCSWGASERVFSVKDLTTANTLFQAATNAGIAICTASGDYGASNGGTGFNVDFPSSSPYVIACGGTTLSCPNLVYDTATTEVGWPGSGGGYSSTFPMPAWQTDLLKPSAPAKRAVPDIAMNADPTTGVRILLGCRVHIYGGTSVVAPAMAALIRCMNIPSFSAAKLYAAARTSYHDITKGINGVGSISFSAGVGYDCVTGLGSPDGTLLANATKALPR